MKKTSILILLVLLAFGQTAWAQWSGSGSYELPYQISTPSDWNTLADNVNNGNTYSDQFFKLMNDISITEMVGESETNSFQGTFDGAGHTLTVSITNTSGQDFGTAPFRYLKNATIKNLQVAGWLESDEYYIGGIAGRISGSCNFFACRSSVTIHAEYGSYQEDNGYHGGLVGDIINGPHSFVNCLFDGRIEIRYRNYVGGLFGRLRVVSGGEHANVSVVNCMFAPSGYSVSHCDYTGVLVPRATYEPYALYHFCHTDNNFGADFGTDANGWNNEQLLNFLGDGWHEVEGKVVPNTAVEVNYSFTGQGTAESPYQIANASDWNKLYMNVLLNNTSGKYYQLTDDIELTETVTSDLPTTMLGSTEDVSFNGTFDGGGHTITVDYTDNSNEHYCAPFRFVKGATIKNLHVAGTIRKANKKHAAGFVGQAYGTNNIIDCRSSVTIEANTDGDGSHGGFLGDLRDGTTNFKNCLFDGSLCGPEGSSSQTTKWGGFVGWVAGGEDAYFTNCVFKPTAINISSKGSSYTFARRDDGDDVHFTNCFYFTAFGNTQGKLAHSISANENVTMTPVGTTESGVTTGLTVYNNDGSYNPCFTYNDVLYSGNEYYVQLSLSQNGPTPENYVEGSFIAAPGFLVTSGENYLLYVPNANVTVSLEPEDWARIYTGSENDPYLIYTEEQWKLLCERVNAGTNNYSGKFFKLMTDITVTEVFYGYPSKQAGYSDERAFSGTFDGNGHTITVSYEDRRDGNYSGLFRIINGATIKNLHVKGGLYKLEDKHAGGLVGRALGTNYILNCRSSVDVSSSTNGDGSNGGFIGDLRTGTTYIDNCLFDGKLRTYSNATDSWGGFIGYSDANAYLTNCLFSPIQVTIDPDDSKTFARGNGIHITNCYYKTDINNAGQGANASNYSNGSLRTHLGDGWIIVTEVEMVDETPVEVEKVVPAMTPRSLDGEGTEESPYLIATTDDWNDLSINVMLGETYSGKFFQLTNNIIVDHMVGYSEANSFQGTFDGDGHTLTFNTTFWVELCAPFRYLNNATIKRLHTTGSIETSSHMVGGIAGRISGTTNITNCISSMVINQTTNGDGTNGGLVANIYNGTLNLTDCLFNGELHGYMVTHNGGLVGWTNSGYGHANITNCLFDPYDVTLSDDNSYTIIRYDNNNATISNCYYTHAFGTTQGTSAIGMNIETLRMHLGEAWEVNGGQVMPIMGPRSFSQGDGTMETPYLIASEEDWHILATNVYLGERYLDEYFKLTNNISVSRMVGKRWTSDGHIYREFFGGIFDGDGHSLTFNYTATMEDAAPFRYLYNAVIKNLHTIGTITTSQTYAAGIAARTYQSTHIENCRSSIVIRCSHAGASYLGGLVALKPNYSSALLTIEGCVFDGKLLSTGATATTSCGGLVGYTSVGNTTIVNCLYAPAALGQSETAVTESATLVGGSPYTITNCYYTEPLGTEQGKQVRSITERDGAAFTLDFTGEATEYNVSGLSTCGTGIKYCDVLYVGNEESANITLVTATGYDVENVTYTPDGGSATTLTPGENVYTYSFTMPNANVTIDAHVKAIEWDGEGSEENPYRIYYPVQLDLLATRVNNPGETDEEAQQGYEGKYFKVMDDLEYDGTPDNYFTIGHTVAFNGHFDGDGHTISGINSLPFAIEGSLVANNGLFGLLGSGAEVKNVILANSTIKDGEKAGGIAAINDGSISGCHVAASVTIAGTNVSSIWHGGIVGTNNGSVSHCTFAGELTKTFYNPSTPLYNYSYGGIAASNDDGASLSDNFVVSATVPATMHYYGAITGRNNSGYLEQNYYVNCTVAGEANATGVGISAYSGGYIRTDISENDGAMPLFNLTLPEGITTTTEATITYNEVHYYKEGITITLGNPPAFQIYYVNGVAITGNSFTMPAEDVTVTTDTVADWSGSGTEEDPYLIYYCAQLDLLAERVNNGNNYDEKYFKLMNDLTYSYAGLDETESNFTSIGSGNQSFSGNFDGNNHTISGIRSNKGGSQRQGLFGFVYKVNDNSPCEVKNIILNDAVFTGGHYTGGIVGYMEGGTITNCHVTSSVIIRAVTNCERHGGIAGQVTSGRKGASVNHCTSSATLTIEPGLTCTYFGGIIGVLFNGTVVSDNFVIGATIPSCNNNYHGAIAGQDNTAHLYSNYYYGCRVGSEEITPTGVGSGYPNQSNLPSPIDFTSNNGAVPGYLITLDEGITCDAAVFTIPAHGEVPEVTYLVATNGTNITLGYELPDDEPTYYVNGVAIIGNTFKMPVMDVTVSIGEPIDVWDGDGSEETPWIIASTEQWDYLANSVALGNSFSGKFFKLGNNITVNTMVGTSSDMFSGTFDGDGANYTLTVDINPTSSEQGIAPFHYINGATIKNFVVDGTVTADKEHAAGLVGFAWSGDILIEDCWVKTDVNSSSSYAGGIVGHGKNANVTIRGCVYTGTLAVTGSNYTGGLLGWCDSGANITLSDCFFNGTYSNSNTNGKFHSVGCSNHPTETTRTFSNLYYTVSPVVMTDDDNKSLVKGLGYKGQEVTSDGATAIGDATATYTHSGLVFYVNGVQMGSIFYYDPNVITLEVAGYSNNDNDRGGYVLLASPIGTVSPTNVANMLSNNYDLYAFDQSPEDGMEWRNYKANTFDLKPGMGYLYANSEDVTLVFLGIPYTDSGEVTLSRTDDVSVDFQGWNLVGNPFTETVYIADNRPFYTMNAYGTEIVTSTSNSIEAMEGVFVVANTDGERMTFTTTAPESNGKGLVLNISQGGVSALGQAQGSTTSGSMAAVVDRAVVRFGEGGMLPKLQLNKNNTKVYIPMDGEDYAVVNAERAGELPVNFKAKENGTYTLSFSSEEVSFNYLHLIDNKTGNDVDLLTTPSYTFNAKTTDYESRFKLVFSTNEQDGPSTGSGTFAFVSNGELIVNGEGTLQVIDMLGRVIISRDGVHTVSTNGMTPGMYVLRLTNGDDVKTQKIVIE